VLVIITPKETSSFSLPPPPPPPPPPQQQQQQYTFTPEQLQQQQPYSLFAENGVIVLGRGYIAFPVAKVFLTVFNKLIE